MMSSMEARHIMETQDVQAVPSKVVFILKLDPEVAGKKCRGMWKLRPGGEPGSFHQWCRCHILEDGVEHGLADGMVGSQLGYSDGFPQCLNQAGEDGILLSDGVLGSLEGRVRFKTESEVVE